jgi:8-hydroxy-5-deazaflavin:NADPH oxidoreductase
MTTIGIIGSGNIGGAVARLGVDHGYDVVVSNSRGPETLTDLVASLGEHARAGTAQEAAAAGDLVLVAVPLQAYPTLPVAALAGKVVMLADNYYPARDGQIAALDDQEVTSAGLVQQVLPSSPVVKVFNHIQAGELTTDGTPAGTADRRALAVFGDSPDARATVAAVLDDLGYDAVDGGPLSESWRIEPGTPGYGPRLTAPELKEALAAATR